MGPRSEGARKASNATIGLIKASPLQWGRARRERGKQRHTQPKKRYETGFNGAALGGSAESQRTGRRFVGIELLQWGRARRERGKTYRRGRKRVLYIELQWGRARRERGKPGAPMCSPATRSCFNGAALGGSAESSAAC